MSLRRAARRLGSLATVATVLALEVSVQATVAHAALVNDPTTYVNPFIGTQNNPNATYTPFGTGYGNDSPAATTPFGMVQWGPDTFNSQITGTSTGNWGGYEYDADQIRGFSLNRLSGTGCETSYGFHDVPFIPFTGALNSNGTLPASPATSPATYRQPFSHSAESASPGYYGVTLNNGAKVELTATARTGMGRFTFPAGQPASLLVNAGGSVNGTSASSVTISGNTVSGSATTTGTCGGGSYTVYFSAQFDQPFTHIGTWSGGTVSANSTSASNNAGAYVAFASGVTVNVRVGLSYVSTSNAQGNVAAENASATFDTVSAAARQAWYNKLRAIRVDGGTDTQLRVFYTALYHALLNPNVFDDSNGQYIGMDGVVHTLPAGRHQYANFSGWDIYRSESQLITLLFPDIGSDLNQSLVNDAAQTGRWYNWPYANRPINIMNGDSLQSVVASIHAFGGTNYDSQSALTSMVTTQSLPATQTIRGGLYEFAGAGYVPRGTTNVWGPAATTLEYSIDDFGIAQLASRLGDQTHYTQFMQRAQNWQNLFNPATLSIHPRDPNGVFVAGYNLNDDNNDQFVEGTGTQYSWLVPQNVRALFDKMGGNAAVVTRLDNFFTNLNAGVHNGAYAWLTNEPTEQTPWLYPWAGRPDRTDNVVRRALSQLYTNTPQGLQGNDDLGQVSSWYVWGALGLYPAIPGRAELIIGSPIFTQAVVTRSNGATITVNAPATSATNQYVTAADVNGVSQTRSWLPESFIGGGTLNLTMAASAGSWGTGAADAPPSFGDYQNGFNNIATSADGSSTTANFDSQGYSYSAQALATAGIRPGSTVTAAGMSFVWPDVPAGSPNSWLVNGQTVNLGGVAASKLSFLGAAGNGPSTGTVTITYTDGTTGTASITLGDWCQSAVTGDTTAATAAYRNSPSGTQSTACSVFATNPITLAAGKSVQSVTLPASTDQGLMHIFAISTADLNNTGTSADGNGASANFDGVGYSYSAQALTSAGVNPGGAVTANGKTFTWPTAGAGQPNNINAAGQTLNLAGTHIGAASLSFLGSADNGTHSGQVTIAYSDGTIDTATLTFGDWCQPAVTGNTVAAAMSYRNNNAGTQTINNYVFTTTPIALRTDKQLVSIKLPNVTGLHVFSVAVN